MSRLREVLDAEGRKEAELRPSCDGVEYAASLAHPARFNSPRIIPGRVALELAEATGVVEQVLASLRLSVVESNGCVSFLSDGRLLGSVSSREYWRCVRAAMAGPAVASEVTE